jgi:hypothetical protein
MSQTEEITWIPVKDRLPDNCEMPVRVLATFFDKKGKRSVESVAFDDISFPNSPWMRLEICNEYEPIDPIAWAKLPKGYES